MRITAFEAGLSAVALAFALIASAPGCKLAPSPQPPVVVEPDPEQHSCATACAKAREHGCAQGDPTPAGATCEQVCENVQASGIVSWDLACRSTAASCAAADACER